MSNIKYNNQEKSDLRKILSENKVKGISIDSRKIKQNDVFFAIRGENFDGNQYIDTALKKGASLVFTDNLSKATQNSRIIFTQDIRTTLSFVAEILYPISFENIIAVTGTNGKSSVVSYVYQILALLGKNAAMIGTLGVESTEAIESAKVIEPKEGVSSTESAECKDSVFLNKNSSGANSSDINFSLTNNNLTTPDIVTLHKTLHILSKMKVENIAFEASSHGLLQKRLGQIKVKTAAFTSFSRDHLDYHHTMEDYLKAKLILFTDHLLPGSEVVINSDMMYFDLVKEFLIKENISYSCVGLEKNKVGSNLRGADADEKDIKIIKNQQSITGQDVFCKFAEKEYNFNTNIIGSFQANNLLIAAKLVHNLAIKSVDFTSIINILHKIKPVTGRLQRITKPNADFQIFVDYAHTPDALEKSLQELQILKQAPGRLYVIFGCGGDRDSSKRPIMGQIAAKNSDYVIVTDDNPRNEDAVKIRNNIIAGIKKSDSNSYQEIGDRREAIINIISKLRENDILLIAGKGHENYQIIGNDKIEFSDIKIAEDAI